MTLIRLAASPADAPPLNPSPRQAHRQLLEELSKQQYQPARPTVIDRGSESIGNWLTKLFNELFGGGVGGGGTALVIVVVGVLLVIAVVVGFLVFGAPRRNRRSASAGSLFGDDDDRDSAALRRAAEAAAARGDYTTAIEEQFRSVARGLAERVVVTTFPGTTAHGFAVTASAAFPALAADLSGAADSFDGVRYLGRAGTSEEWKLVSELDRTLRASRPVREPDGASA
jgi:Domain of unknown function (DUF4129)